jgi:hypothetical protein
MPGYEGNAAAALAVLEVLERHVRVEPRLAGAIRDLARQAQARSDPAPN